MKKILKDVTSHSTKSKKKELLVNVDKFENICMNASCKLRKAGCRGFEGCPGYKGK